MKQKQTVTKTAKTITLLILLLVSLSFVNAQTDSPIVNKIHKDLWEKINQQQSISIAAVQNTQPLDVLIQARDETQLQNIKRTVEQNGGKVTNVFEVGDIVTASVPVQTILKTAEQQSVQSIWSPQKYEILLQESVPQIGAQALHNLGYYGSGVKVAVIDSGIDHNHPDFIGRIVDEDDFVPSSYISYGVELGDGDDDHIASDEIGHGTHVAGIIAGTGNTYQGVAPQASLLIAKVFGNDSAMDPWIIDAINWALDPDGNPETDDGADIISMSLGSNQNVDGPLNAAVRDAIQQGATVVIASGNDGYSQPSTPGNVQEAITVGAIDDDNNWATFSSGYDYGTYLKPDVSAPGVRIISTSAKNSIMEQGASIIDDIYIAASGTSMATPHVSGAIALLLEENPDLTPSQIKDILIRTATDRGQPGTDIQYGAGIINLQELLPGNIEKLLKYKITLTQNAHPSDAIDITVDATIPSLVEEISAQITNPNIQITNLALVNITSDTWQTEFTSTTLLGLYNVEIKVTEKDGSIQTFQESFSITPFEDAQGTVVSIESSDTGSINSEYQVETIVENTGTQLVTSHIEIQLLDQNETLLQTSESETVIVNAGETYTFTNEMILDQEPGQYHLDILAFFDTYVQKTRKTLTIVDETPPSLVNESYQEAISKNNPFVYEITIQDNDDLSGELEITNPQGTKQTMQFHTIASTDQTSVLTATSEFTSELGSYTFTANICDSGNRCIQTQEQSFTVTTCDQAPLLIVKETDQENIETHYDQALNNNYCLSFWNLQKSPIPSLEYLQIFDGVFWSTGSIWGENINVQSEELLKEYVKGSSALVLEGPDIASFHQEDEFLQEVVHASFIQEIDIQQEQNAIITKTDTHPFFRNINTVLQIQNDSSITPDVVAPINDAKKLARWQNGQGALIMYNQGQTKTLFVPFMINTIKTDSTQILQNLAQWLTTNEANTNAQVTKIQHDYIINGENTITITLNNAGSESIQDAPFTLYLDEEVVHESTTSLDSEEEKNIEISLNLQNIGSHTLKAVINDEASIEETSYTDNSISKEIFVASILPDYIVQDIEIQKTESNLHIHAHIQNQGGVQGNDISVELYIDETKEAQTTIDLQEGETETVSFIVDHFNTHAKIEIRVNENTSPPPHNEYNESNNRRSLEDYFCQNSNILIVNDNDASSWFSSQPENVEVITNALQNEGHCITEINQEEEETEMTADINRYDLLIWSTGHYFFTVIDESDQELLNEFQGPILFEGADIAYDHVDDSLMINSLQSVLDEDFEAIEDYTLTLDTTHPILSGISGITIESGIHYPDSLKPLTGKSIASWPEKQSAIITSNTTPDMAYFAFGIDKIDNEATAHKLIQNAVAWLTQQVDTVIQANETFILKNDQNETVFSIDENGNLLANTITQSSPQINQQSSDLLTIISSESVSTRINEQGNVEIKDILYTSQETIESYDEINDIVIKNKQGTVVAVLSHSGEIYLQGKVLS